MDYCLQPAARDGAETPLFDVARGCATFAQRLLHVAATPAEGAADDGDEVLYVLDGSGTIDVGDGARDLRPGSAAFVPRGGAWRIEAAEELVVLAVLVCGAPATDASPAVLDLDSAHEGAATAGRQFRLLATPDVGCASATQFVGYIPVGRAPDHFHTYDEVVYVLEGHGALHVDGESAPLEPGTAVHLPARLVHCLENRGPGEMRVLGVFRPAGSPAEAYYPDGTRAQY